MEWGECVVSGGERRDSFISFSLPPQPLQKRQKGDGVRKMNSRGGVCTFCHTPASVEGKLH